MQPGLRRPDVERAGELASGRLDERLLPLGVEHSRAPDVAGEVPLGHELRQHRLLYGGRVPVGELARRAERLHEVRGDDEVLQPEGGEEDLLKVPT